MTPMESALWPTLDDVKAWLAIDGEDDYDDVVLSEAMAASRAAQMRLLTFPCDEFGDKYVPDDIRQAFLLRVQRYSARRNSPEGIVGLSGGAGDFVSARVSSTDPDIMRLESPWLTMVVA